jgi:hypothetical protein
MDLPTFFFIYYVVNFIMVPVSRFGYLFLFCRLDRNGTYNALNFTVLRLNIYCVQLNLFAAKKYILEHLFTLYPPSAITS